MHRGLRLPALDPEGHPVAAPAAVEAEHEARPVRRAPVDMGEDAERAVITVEMGVPALDEGKARPPHEGAVAEDPQIVLSVPHSPTDARPVPDPCPVRALPVTKHQHNRRSRMEEAVPA